MSEKRTYEELEKRIQELEQAESECKRTEKMLQRSEALLSATQQLTKVGGWEWDVEKQTMFWTDEVYRIHDFQPSEFIPGSSKHIERGIECYDPEDRPVIMDAFRNCAEKGQAYDLEFLFTTAMGRRIWIRTIAEPVLKGDRVVRVIGNIMDITKRKQAQEALKEGELKFRLFADYTYDWEYWIDSDNNYIYLSPSCERISGYSTEEFISNPELIYKIVRPDYAEKVQPHYDDENDKETPAFSMKFPIITSTGEERWLEHNCTPIFDDQGNYAGRRGNNRDITERKQAEDALRESEEKLSQAVQGNSIPTFLIDNNHVITHWNKACESLTGFSAAEMMGTKKHWLAFYDEKRPVLADYIVNGATEEEIGEYYERIPHKSILIEGAYEGENFYPTLGEKGKWLFFTSAPLRNQGGNIIGAIETFQDITKRRSTEEQLRQSQKMEAIGTLAGGVAHDFNNILTTIIGNASLALMEVDKDGPVREELYEIKTAGERAAALTRQLLAFSRKQIVQPKVVDLNELLPGMEKMLGRLLSEDVELLTILEPSLWQVETDSGQMEQVIMNLVINARDAMSKGGKLTVETANVDLDGNYFRKHAIKEGQPGTYVMLAISDTGSGMDKETREHIFEPFYTTKEQGKGTGLGLSTVYGIVKQNNGFIWVYSEPGQGTTFKIYLPKVKEDVVLEEKERPPVTELGGSETVLIVEDDDSLRNLVQKTLQQHGYRILVAENGEDALRVSVEHEGSIQLIITDVVMPKMNGKETVERLQPLYPHMKVIYMSGYTDNSIVHHGVLAPGLNFLEKPFSPEGVVCKVREVLNK